MGCCQKKKKEINQKLADDLYNESLVPDLSPSDAQTSRTSKEPEIKESFTPSLENKGSSLEGQGASLDDFKPLKILGQGSFGKVILVKNETNDNVYAMKILEKKHLIKKNQISHTKTERIALEKLKHPFIIKLHYAFQDLKNLYLITEFERLKIKEAHENKIEFGNKLIEYYEDENKLKDLVMFIYSKCLDGI